MNTVRRTAIAMVGTVALGVGAGCTSFWAASAPDAPPKQQMEKPTPIEDDTEMDDARAEASDETDSAETDTEPGAGEGEVGGMGTTGSDTGAETDSEASAEEKPKMPMKMTVAAAAPKTATADFYWDVERNTAMGTKELKVQLVAADSGAELKTCREVKVSAGTQSFMGERVGIEVEKRTERLTAYLPQDALDKLAAAEKIDVFVCEYEFGLAPAQTKKFSDMKASEAEIESESKPASDASDDETGSSFDDEIKDAAESDDLETEDSGGVGSPDDDY